MKPRKHPGGTYPAFCGSCHGPIDLDAVGKAIRAKREVTHDCGRVLVREPGWLKERVRT